MVYPQKGWRRFLFRAPLILWRLGLGPLLGQIILLLTHTGRKSSLPRRTLVEYYRLDGRPYVICAWGRQSQWGQNLLADPRCTIQTARGTENAMAVRVQDDEELCRVYELFMRRNPPLTHTYLKSQDIRPDPDDLIAKKERVYCFRFDPSPEAGPPPQPADLVWVWPLVGAAGLVFYLARKRLAR